MTKYYLHRIQKQNGTYTKGIEVYDNLDGAILSFWGRMKTGYNNPAYPGMTFVSCKITDTEGTAYGKYNRTWLDPDEPPVNVFFLHSIRTEGETVTKGIDIYENKNAAIVAYASAMEYGYENPKHADVDFVACEITDLLSGGMVLSEDRWKKPEAEAAEE